MSDHRASEQLLYDTNEQHDTSNISLGRTTEEKYMDAEKAVATRSTSRPALADKSLRFSPGKSPLSKKIRKLGSRLSALLKLGHDWCRPWSVELGCILLSCMLLISTIVILFIYNGTTLPRWRYGLSLNTIISILTVFSTFTLVAPISAALGQLKWMRFVGRRRELDEFRILHNASHGIQGSMELLVNRKGGLLAAAGAILTILGLAINPFMQQVIDYELVHLPINQAWLPICNNTLYGTDVTALSSGDSHITSAVARAATVNVQTQFNVTPICPSANCTWPDYSTIAMCSRCSNLTSYLKPEQTKDGKIRYQLPNGIGIEPPFGTNGTFLIASVNNTMQTSPYHSTTPALKSVAYGNVGGIALDMFYAYAENEVHMNDPQAYECILQYCIHTRRASVTNNVLSDELLSKWTNNSAEAIAWNTKLFEGIYEFPNWSSTLESDYFFYMTAPESHGTTFYIDFLLAEVISRVIWPLFTGEMFTTMLYDGSYIYDTGVLQGWPFQFGSKLFIYMSNVASSVSAALRQQQYDIFIGLTDGPPLNLQDFALEGTSWTYQYHVHIAWVWLAMPCSMLLLSVLFFLVVVFESDRQALHPWKQSVLPILYHGSSVSERAEWDTEDWTELEDLDGMERRARKTTVELNRLENRRWELASSRDMYEGT